MHLSTKKLRKFNITKWVSFYLQGKCFYNLLYTKNMLVIPMVLKNYYKQTTIYIGYDWCSDFHLCMSTDTKIINRLKL